MSPPTHPGKKEWKMEKKVEKGKGKRKKGLVLIIVL